MRETARTAVPSTKTMKSKNLSKFTLMSRAVFVPQKEIVSGDWSLIFILVMVLVEMSLGYYIKSKFLAYPVFCFSILLLFSGYFKIQKWLDKFGYVLTEDEEFLFAKGEMNRSRLIWLAAIILNLFLWFIRIKFL